MSRSKHPRKGIAAVRPKVSQHINAPSAIQRLFQGAGPRLATADAIGDGNAIIYHGGRVLTTPRVKPIFWGTAWFRPWLQPGPSAGDILWAMKTIFLGPYMSGLSQYDGVGRGSILSEIFVSLTNDPPNPLGQHDIESMLTSLTVLPDGRLLNPERDSQLLCCVFTPPGFKSTDEEANGYHTFFLSNGGAVPYAWISNDGTLDFISSVYSHELAEACTDPVNAFYDNTGACGQAGPCEVSDFCYGNGPGRGWWKVGGVLVQGYWSLQDGRCMLPTERSVPGLVKGNASLIQGRFLSRGNFEMVAPLRSGGLAHYSRVNDDPAFPWFGPTIFGVDVGQFDAVTLIQSNFTSGGNHGNLELVAREGGQLLFYWREDQPPYVWHGPAVVPTAGAGQNFHLVTGNPSLIQGRFGVRGNFELVVPLASGGIAHYSRVNDAAGVPWSEPAIFATDIGVVDAVSLQQSNLSSSGGGAGDLHVVVRLGSELLFYRRDDGPPYTWHGPEVIPLNSPTENGRRASGIPSLVFQNFGAILNGYDQLVTPLADGGFGHYTRDNNSPGVPWRGPAVVGVELGQFGALSLIHSNFSSTNSGVGNLELVAMAGSQLVHFWREDNTQIAGGDTRSWFGPWLVTS